MRYGPRGKRESVMSKNYQSDRTLQGESIFKPHLYLFPANSLRDHLHACYASSVQVLYVIFETDEVVLVRKIYLISISYGKVC